MDYKLVVGDILRTLEMMSDPGRAELSKNYFPTSMKVIGVTNPDMQRIIKELKSRNSVWSERAWIGLCKALVGEGIFECQGIAYELMGRSKKILNALQYEDVAELGRNLDNWASVDGYGVGVHGVLWRKGVIMDKDIQLLLQSTDHWQRRLAVVSTVALNLKSRGGTGDTQRTLWVCEQVVDDHQDKVQKALSWALRELSKSDREAVESFMDRYESRLARRVVREVRHKLEYGTKN